MQNLALRQRVGISLGIIWLLISVLISLLFGHESIALGVGIFLVLGVFPVILIGCFWWVLEGVNWTKKKLILSFGVIVTASLIIFCYAYVSNSSSIAVLNAKWGMSEKEVKRANSEGSTKWSNSFLPLDMDGERGVLQPAPSSAYNAKKVVMITQKPLFMPEYAKSFTVGYYFLDDSLYGYSLSYTTKNPEEALKIAGKLRDKYGKGMLLKQISENEIAAIGWAQKNQHIFFSFRKNTERSKYFVNIEVTYLPIYNKIYNQ